MYIDGHDVTAAVWILLIVLLVVLIAHYWPRR